MSLSYLSMIMSYFAMGIAVAAVLIAIYRDWGINNDWISYLLHDLH